MIKIVDVDALFDKYISDYVYKNIGKLKPEEIENKIPEMYVSFGKEKLKEFENKTPVEYYDGFSATELIEGLKNHVKSNVAVPDFLVESLQKKDDCDTETVRALIESEDEEFILYLLNVVEMIKTDKADNRCVEFILYDYSQPVKELATEILCENPERVKDKILSGFYDSDIEVKEYLCEILCKCKWDDKVFDALIEAFVKGDNKIPVFASYLAKYGDDRAIRFLKEKAQQNVTYADFEELRFAIEALGGECDIKRDFSEDKTYKKIKGSK